MEFWAGNRKNPYNSISPQQTGALSYISDTLTPNNWSVFHPIELKFGTFVETINTHMSAQSGMLSMEKHGSSNLHCTLWNFGRETVKP